MQISNTYYMIVDLEATCSDDGTVPRDEMEIIEIGAVMLHARTFELESEFQSFVRPVRHPELTRFCMELTNIAQADVNDAPGFPDVLAGMLEWSAAFHDALFCSWGAYDRNQFLQDCEYHHVPYPFSSGHLNLKEAFSRAKHRKPMGVTQALRHLGLQFEGAHHRGLDDARNIARIVQQVCMGF